MYAAHYKRTKIFKFLLDKGFFNIDEQDATGLTTLMYAVVATKDRDSSYPHKGSMFADARDCMYLMIQLLLENGANEELKDKNGKTYLDYGDKLEPRYNFKEQVKMLKRIK